jgi:hypothetical protein
MKAEIKSIFSPDIEVTLKEYQPERANNFGFLLQMIISPEGEEGEESFDIMVCTPDWLKDNHSKDEIIFGRHHLIVFKYDYQAIYQKLAKYVNSIEANTWDEISSLIGRVGHWEFEDYKV